MRYESEFMEGGAEKFVALANSSVPFLNGGLFDCLDDKPRGLYYDGFSELPKSLEQLSLPDYLFFGEEVSLGRFEAHFSKLMEQVFQHTKEEQ